MHLSLSLKLRLETRARSRLSPAWTLGCVTGLCLDAEDGWTLDTGYCALDIVDWSGPSVCTVASVRWFDVASSSLVNLALAACVEQQAAAQAKSCYQLARIPNSNAECELEKNIQMPRRQAAKSQPLRRRQRQWPHECSYTHTRKQTEARMASNCSSFALSAAAVLSLWRCTRRGQRRRAQAQLFTPFWRKQQQQSLNKAKSRRTSCLFLSMSLSLTLAPTLSISLSLLAPLGSLTLYASLCCLKKLFVVFSVAFCCFPTLEQLWFDFGLFAWVLLLFLLMPDFEHEWACCCSLWHTVCVGELCLTTKTYNLQTTIKI